MAPTGPRTVCLEESGAVPGRTGMEAFLLCCVNTMNQGNSRVVCLCVGGGGMRTFLDLQEAQAVPRRSANGAMEQ